MNTFEEKFLERYFNSVSEHGEDKIFSDSLTKRCFIVACEGVFDILDKIVDWNECRVKLEDVPEEVYEHILLPVIIPLVNSIKQYQEALEQQIKYGTKITVTTEQMENIKKELDK